MSIHLQDGHFNLEWSSWAEALDGHPEAYPEAHTDPVKCPAVGCGATFMLASPLWAHIESQHKDKEAKHQCCPKHVLQDFLRLL